MRRQTVVSATSIILCVHHSQEWQMSSPELSCWRSSVFCSMVSCLLGPCFGGSDASVRMPLVARDRSFEEPIRSQA